MAAKKPKPPVDLRAPPRASPKATRAAVDAFVNQGTTGALPRGAIQRADGRVVVKKTLYLPPELDASLRVYAAQARMDESELAIAAITAYLAAHAV